MKKVASLQYGVIFKKAFSKPHIFTAFAKDILGIELDIKKVETEKSFSPIVGRVDSRFDLYGVDEKNRVIVDIQHKRYSDHYDRFLHYHCVALIEQIQNAYNYKPPLNVYTIVVLTTGDKHKQAVSITDFRPQDLEGNYLSETEHKIIYICPKYLNEKTPEVYREWLMAIEDSLDEEVSESEYKNEKIQEIFSIIEKDNVDPKERARMIDEYSDAEYLQEKEQKARKEGEKKGKIEIAKNLLDILDIETIALKTGLSIEDIEKLKK